MAQDHQNVEMQDKVDGGCLSPADEEREPCLKESAAAESVADKNNGTVSGAAAATAAVADEKKPLDNNNGNGTVGSGGHKFYALAAATSLEQKLRDKTGFSRTGLVVAGVAVLLFLVLLCTQVVTLIMWPRPPRVFPVCRSVSCLRASAEVLPKIDFTQSPCVNFKDYACGGWLQTNSLPAYMSAWSLKKRIQQDEKIKIRNMVVTLRNVASSNSLNWKMKHFYESCTNLDNIETDEGKPLKKIITSLGGWHVLKDFNVNDWEPIKTIVLLHSKYSVSPFFKIDVVPDEKVEGSNIIQISPAGLGLPDRRFYYRQQDDGIVKAYKQYMVDVSQILGATSGDASIFSNDMFHYEKRIAEITPPMKQDDPFTSHGRFPLSKLKETAGMVPLLDILQSKFPNSEISEDTTVSVISPYYFSNLSNLMSSSDRSGLNDYYMWKLAETYVPYLSVKFREIVKIYMAELTGEKDLPPRWESCVTLLQKFMGFGIAATLERNIENRAGVVSVVNGVFDNIKTTIVEGIERSLKMEPELKDFFLEKLRAISVQVGIPENQLQENYVNQFYSQLPVQKLDFFQNINHATSFAIEYSQTRLKSKKEEHGWLDDLTAEDPKVTYNIAANKVIVPMALLVPPYFETGYPEALLYGGLGVEISSAILSSIHPPGVAYNKDGILLSESSLAVNRSVRATVEAGVCYGQFMLDNQNQPVVNTTALSAMSAVVGVQYALSSLARRSAVQTYYHQPAMENFNYDALFYITYAQSLCSIKSRQQQELDTMYDLMSDESLLLKTVADHTSAFGGAFHCPDTPVKYCKSEY